MMDAIIHELNRIARTVTGTVGVCAQHLESGRRVDFHADLRFPMASLFKLPVVVDILCQVDHGQLSLDQLIEVRSGDLSPGSGTLRSLLYQPGLILSVQNLIELTLVISDNTAADVLLQLAGGPLVVTQFLRDQQIDGIRIDRLVKQLVADKYGVSAVGPDGSWSLATYQALLERLTPAQATTAAAAFAEDERDTLTPSAMVAFLAQVYAAEWITPGSRDRLLDVMGRCQSGAQALKGMLPPGVHVAHKTGTLAEVVANDVGIVTLPDGSGHLALAVCVKSPQAAGGAESASQRVIAHAARAVYDYFLFQ